MGMYFKDKTEIFKLRLTKEQADYVNRLSLSLGCSKSQAIRFIIDTVRLGEKYYEDK